MITEDGAGLLAQVLPVGLLILALEAGRNGHVEPAEVRGARTFIAIVRNVGYFTILGAIGAEVLCVLAVMEGRPITDSLQLFVVGSAALLLAVTAGLVLVVSFLQTFRTPSRKQRVSEKRPE